jgi:hypothetical protein
MKNTITEILCYGIKWDLDGKTLQEAISFLQETLENVGDEAIIDLLHNEEDGVNDINIILKREETDYEQKSREDKALREFMRKQEIQKKNDLAELARIQARLGIK